MGKRVEIAIINIYSERPNEYDDVICASISFFIECYVF